MMFSRAPHSAVNLVSGLAAVLFAFALSGSTSSGEDKAAPAVENGPGADWKRVWADEFDAPAVDRKKWAFDVGNRPPGGPAGWGNRELQYYTDRPDNVYVRDGMLHVRALREAHEGAAFTSARLKTKGLFAKKYGRFEVRARLPTGKGVWPAIWMLPEDNKYGGWAASGEIDIVEARGQEPTKVLGTLHYGSPAPGNLHTGKDYVLPDGGTVADFHFYALEWDPGEIRWYVDGRLYQTQKSWWSSSRRPGRGGARNRGGTSERGAAEPAGDPKPNPWPAPFDQPFHLLLNVAVGGNFLGNPDADTQFPVEMVVDYVRVFDRVAGYGNPMPRGEGKLPAGPG
jgi:beta-glucanase (GH16 family)